MIKINGSISVEEETDISRKVKVPLIADTKDEVIAIGSDGSTVLGLKDGDVLQLGSTCLCATGDFGIINSSGSWTF